MILESVKIHNVRKVVNAELLPGAGVNVIGGPNGSGKTSLLEAIYLLSNGRSFRTNKVQDIITEGRRSLMVFGLSKDQTEERLTALGVEKDFTHTRIKVNGEVIRTASSLARALPTLVLNAESFSLLEGMPASRRALLDRTLFHVEPSYLGLLKQYHRALKHRNELLRANGNRGAALFWHGQLNLAGEQIDSKRLECVGKLNSLLESSPISDCIGQLKLDYRRGWRAGVNLGESLEASWERDKLYGNASVGPHRAEMKVVVNEKSAVRSASRGQTKAILAAIIAAQTTYISSCSINTPILLVDDLPAELDSHLKSIATSILVDTQAQIFFTTIDHESLATNIKTPMTLFHVKQGKVDTLSSQVA